MWHSPGYDRQLQELFGTSKAPVRIYRNYPLSKLSTYRIGGPASFFVEVLSLDALCSLLAFFAQTKTPWLPVGKGSNILFGDAGLDIVVVRLAGALCEYTIANTEVTVGGGMLLPRFAKHMSLAARGGLEYFGGIPGTVSGAIYMNAGCLGRSISDNLQEVTAIDSWGCKHTLERDELSFGYRNSSFMERDWVIAQARFSLPYANASMLMEIFGLCMRQRRLRLPLAHPSAGSIFKKTTDGTGAGYLIERAGLKGLRCGGALISPRHANFILNLGQATAQDVLTLVAKCREEVQAQFAKPLELEVRVITREDAPEIRRVG